MARILIVDDKAEDRYLLEVFFQGKGHEVFSAPNGKEALEKLGATEVDIVVSDILMPVMDGFRLCQEVRRDDRLKKTPFVFYTATYTDERDEELALKLGADRFFRKPMDLEELVTGVLDVLKERDRRREEEIVSLPEEGEETVLELYNERLVRKLEKRNVELQKLQQKYQTLCENVSDLIFSLDEEGFFTDANRKTELLGYRVEEVIGKHFTEFLTPKSREIAQHHFEKAKARESRRDLYEVEVLKKDGTIAHVELSMSTLYQEGRFFGRFGVARDISERKRAEVEMASLQEQLRQAQKMEAVGRLAGGIAHDFNNVLTVMKGTCQLSLLDLRPQDPLYANLKEIERCVDRAADLTRQLLIFSRKQVIEMRVLDLNRLIKNLDKMLHRLLGEDVELVTSFDEHLGTIKADPGQLEQVIINLVVNARDAMPRGGKLTIETSNVELDEEYGRKHIGVEPGPYVMVSVSDTGVGMTPEVRERIFEPFFTTKAEGRGTGLGLSTVYGIVKQIGGSIWVYSEPGRGTTFKIYLPRVDAPLEEIKKETLPEIPRGTETVLVVEDERTVRELAVRLLKKQGYNVLEAADGGKAFLLCEKHREPIHLILTDVVMPGMSGRELAERLRKIHPEARVLFMSGYTDDVIFHHGVLSEGTGFIEKPFTLETLARKVRQVLGKA